MKKSKKTKLHGDKKKVVARTDNNKKTNEAKKPLTIIRAPHNKDNPYAVISKQLIHDKRLSLVAVGLMTKFLSMPSDWDFNMAYFIKISKEGKDAIKTAVDELVEFGYLEKKRTRKKDGTFEGWSYLILEKSPKAGFPTSVNPPLLSTESSSKKKKQKGAAPPKQSEAVASSLSFSLIEFFIDSLKKSVPAVRNFKITHADLSHMDQILKNYSEEEIKTAITFSHTNQFWKQHVHSISYLKQKIAKLLTSCTQSVKDFSDKGKITPEKAYELRMKFESYVKQNHKYFVEKQVSITAGVLYARIENDLIYYTDPKFTELVKHSINKRMF